jgi:hypothetical protein
MSGAPPLANLITLGAGDFATLRDFYRRPGWPQVWIATISPPSNSEASSSPYFR